VVEGKRVVLVDDSIVRGTSMLKISNMMRAAGAREVHVRISAPPTIRPCHYGIDMPTREELIAANHSIDEIRRAIGADSLGYLSLESLRRAGMRLKHEHCDACFSDDYPVPVAEDGGPPQLSLFRTLEDEPRAGDDE
jgi:amidophosphoribosyltransferase